MNLRSLNPKHATEVVIKATFLWIVSGLSLVVRSHWFSINCLKFCRYLSIRRETTPPKLEVNFRVMHVLWSGSDAKETTPAARWSRALWSAIVRQANLRSGTHSIISSIVSYCFPLKASAATKGFGSNFRTLLITVINFG